MMLAQKRVTKRLLLRLNCTSETRIGLSGEVLFCYLIPSYHPWNREVKRAEVEDKFLLIILRLRSAIDPNIYSLYQRCI